MLFRTRISVIIVSIVSIIVLAIFAYLQNSFQEYTYQRIHTQLKQQLELSVNYFSILTRNEESQTKLKEFDSIADKLGNDLGLRVTIIDMSGKVQGDSMVSAPEIPLIESHANRPEVQGAVKTGFGENRRLSRTVSEKMLYVASVSTDLTSGEKFIIRLSMPLSEIEQTERQFQAFLLISLVIGVIMAVSFSYFAAQVISKPIIEITQLASGMAEGDFSKKVLLSQDDEVGQLGRIMNRLSEQTKARIDDVMISKSRLEAVFASMAEGVMIVDNQGQILLMNQALRRFFNVSGETTGRRPLEIIRHPEIQKLVNDALNLNTGVIAKELSIILDEEKILSIHAAPIFRNEEREGAVLVVHDVSELRKLEKIRRDFVANVSHELRTPIATIKGYAETLIDGALDDKQNATDFIKIIYQDADRLSTLINDILELSRIEAGNLILNFGPHAFGSVLNRVLAVLMPLAKDKNVTISQDFPNNLPQVQIDENRISQVLLNLIENAIKYNKPGGNVHISVTKIDREFVEVSIEDTGIGIPAEDIPRIFERFYRVDKAHSRQLGGTGLGLSIVKHLIQAHHGEVSVESIIGVGSTFRFTLPKA